MHAASRAFLGVPVLLFCSALPLLAQPSASQPTEPPEASGAGSEPSPAPPFACETGVWRLSGASAAPHEAARFEPTWAADVSEMATCLKALASEHACLLVQGHFDVSSADAPDAIARFGEDSEARLVRAKAQAAVVMRHLYEAGAVPGQLHQVPARVDRTFRGALVSLQHNCPELKLGHFMEATERAERQQYEQKVAGPPVPAVAAPEPPDRPALGVAFYAQHLADVARAGTWDYTARTQLGLSLRPSQLYLEVAAGFGLSPDALSSVGYQVRAQAGYRGLFASQLGELLRLGLAAGYQQASRGAFDAWLTREVWLGVHAAQCFSLDGHPLHAADNVWGLCAEQTLSPLGQRVTRGAFANDRLFILPQRSDYRFGFDVGARLEVKL